MSAVLRKNFHQCDLKWNYLLVLIHKRSFRFKCVSSCKQHFHCRKKFRKKATKVGYLAEFIDQQYAKRSLIPKKDMPNITCNNTWYFMDLKAEKDNISNNKDNTLKDKFAFKYPVMNLIAAPI
jgi:hypothetical protein